jgi:hypothetical protein
VQSNWLAPPSLHDELTVSALVHSVANAVLHLAGSQSSHLSTLVTWKLHEKKKKSEKRFFFLSAISATSETPSHTYFLDTIAITIAVDGGGGNDKKSKDEGNHGFGCMIFGGLAPRKLRRKAKAKDTTWKKDQYFNYLLYNYKLLVNQEFQPLARCSSSSSLQLGAARDCDTSRTLLIFQFHNFQPDNF